MAAIMLGFFDLLIMYRHRKRISLAIVHPAGCGHSALPETVKNYKYNISISYPLDIQSNWGNPDRQS
jgi:hypothetical protein